MKKRIRIIISWILVSLLLQFSLYAYFNNRIAKIMAPPKLEPISVNLEATIPNINLTDLQISYDKNYLAYIDEGTLKVFDLKNNKFIFEKDSESDSPTNMGVLKFQWLPDRDTLIYLFAHKNLDSPNSNQSISKISSASINQVKMQEDPNQSNNEKDTPAVPPAPVVPREYNPQITDLYTLDFSNGEGQEPEDRKNITIDNFPSDGTVKQIVFSTQTNLIYITVQTESSMKLMEIDVMKNVRTLNKYGEWIDSMVASDRFGTLYIQSKLNDLKQIIALKGWERQTISEKANDIILGVNNGIVYIGEIKDNNLVKIVTFNDVADLDEKISFNTFWEGSIPFAQSKVVIGVNDRIIVYDSNDAYVINEGSKVRQIPLDGDENYISSDGVELIKLNKENGVTHVELKPIE